MTKKSLIPTKIKAQIQSLSASGLEPRLIAAKFRLPMQVVLTYSTPTPAVKTNRIPFPEREQIRALIRDGFSTTQIARMTGRSNTAIGEIRNEIGQEAAKC